MSEIIDIELAKFNREVTEAIDNMYQIEDDYNDSLYFVVKNAEKIGIDENRNCFCEIINILLLKKKFIEKVEKIKKDLKIINLNKEK